jgi:hypothetical protein
LNEGSEIKRSSSMFISKTKRGVSATTAKTSKSGKGVASGVLQYDVESKTINATVRQKVDTITNPLLANLAKKSQTGFSTLAPRFNNNNADEAVTFVGPGYYEQKG